MTNFFKWFYSCVKNFYHCFLDDFILAWIIYRWMTLFFVWRILFIVALMILFLHEECIFQLFYSCMKNLSLLVRRFYSCMKNVSFNDFILAWRIYVNWFYSYVKNLSLSFGWPPWSGETLLNEFVRILFFYCANFKEHEHIKIHQTLCL